MNTLLYVLIAILALAVAGLAYRWVFGARKSALYKDYIDAGRRAAQQPRARASRTYAWDATSTGGRGLR